MISNTEFFYYKENPFYHYLYLNRYTLSLFIGIGRHNLFNFTSQYGSTVRLSGMRCNSICRVHMSGHLDEQRGIWEWTKICVNDCYHTHKKRRKGERQGGTHKPTQISTHPHTHRICTIPEIMYHVALYAIVDIHSVWYRAPNYLLLTYNRLFNTLCYPCTQANKNRKDVLTTHKPRGISGRRRGSYLLRWKQIY